MRKKINWKNSPLLVGTISTRIGLKWLSRKNSPADLIELRVDSLLADGVDPEKILDALRQRLTPVLLTLRLPSEGGDYPWAVGERAALFTALMPDADAVDIELASAFELSPILLLCRKLKMTLVLSAHSIRSSISLATLKKWMQTMEQTRPDVAKIAVLLKTRADLRELARLLLDFPHQRSAMMGVGKMAPISRQVLGALGSALIYGYLDKAAAPGQPRVKDLAMLVKGLR